MSEPIGAEIVQRLMRHLIEIDEGKLSCQDAFALLDEYADLCCHQKEAKQLMPLVENHLHQCPDCLAFYEALLSILQAPEGVTNG